MSAMEWIGSLLTAEPDLGYISQSHLAEIQKREGVEGLDEELSRGVRVPRILTPLERKHLWRQD